MHFWKYVWLLYIFSQIFHHFMNVELGAFGPTISESLCPKMCTRAAYLSGIWKSAFLHIKFFHMQNPFLIAQQPGFAFSDLKSVATVVLQNFLG